MTSYYWDEQIAYLTKSTSLYYNDDYLRFLVERVWKIEQAVDVVDFGCGFGHLGLRLLPLLPLGSTYTGIDAGVKLIERARGLFEGSPYAASFVVGDIRDAAFDRSYDLAVCHAVLLHMTNPIGVLERMKDCVKQGGKIIAFEPHWNGSHAGYYLEGIELSTVFPLGQLQELFERDVRRTNKDGNIGIKLPLCFNRLGLRDVQCRVSDRVNIHDPAADREQASRLFEAMRFGDPGDRETYIAALTNRGMSPEEARRQYEAEKRCSEVFTASTAAAYAPGMKITFGTV